MKTILYALAGEGLGHASRTYALYEQLKDKYDIHFFTFGDAYQFFQDAQVPNLHLIDGIKWARLNGRINYADTYDAYSKLKDNKDIFAGVRNSLGEVICVTDFEPTITKYALEQKIPLISIDNQHKFSRCINKDLSFGLRAYASIMGWFTEFFIKKPVHCIVSTFYHSLAKKTNNETTTVNVFIRNDFSKDRISNDGTILVYDKNNLFSESILPILAKQNKQVIVYNNKLTEGFGFTYHKLNRTQFVVDLHKCDKVICTAGNQLLGEAIYLNKPILAIPEEGQYEQYINAFYIAKMKAGMTFRINALNEYGINEFLSFMPDKIVAENGVTEAVDVLIKEVQ